MSCLNVGKITLQAINCSVLLSYKINFMVKFINEQRDAGKRRQTWKLRHAESLLFLVLVRPYLCVFPSSNGFDYLLIKLHTMACASCRCFIAIRTKNTTNTSHQTISVTAIFIFTEVTLTNSPYCGRGLNLINKNKMCVCVHAWCCTITCTHWRNTLHITSVIRGSNVSQWAWHGTNFYTLYSVPN